MNDETTPPRARRKIIMFGLPTRDQVHMDFAMTLCANAIDLCHILGILPANPRACYIACNRNDIVVAALEHDADWVMFIDSDIEAPQDAVRRLLAHDKDIVGGNYIRRSEPYETLMGKPLRKSAFFEAEGLIEMEYLPTGFMLIKTDVFRKMQAPWFRLTWTDGKPTPDLGEDYYFCEKAREAGFDIWCDGYVTSKIGHHADIALRPKVRAY